MTKPSHLKVEPEKIPTCLKEIPQWVLWAYTLIDKPDGSQSWVKKPLQASGRAAKSNTKDTWTTFEHALATLEKRPDVFDGLGFVFALGGDLIGIDIDDCLDPITEELSDLAKEILSRVKGYAEVSPSGTGIKIFTRGHIETGHTGKGLEIYPQGRYFTVTGRRVRSHQEIPAEEQEIGWVVERVLGTRPGDGGRPVVRKKEDAWQLYRPPLEGWTLDRVREELAPNLDVECHYDDWIRVGAALYHQFEGSEEAFALWDEIFQDSSKYGGEAYGRERWRSFRTQRLSGRGPVTLASVIWSATQTQTAKAKSDGFVVLRPAYLIENANSFLDAKYRGPEGLLLRRGNGSWYGHCGTHYRAIEEATVRAAVWHFLDAAKKPGSGGGVGPFLPKPEDVSATLDALKAVVHLDAPKPPVWLDGVSGADPGELVSLQNGLLHIPSRVLGQHTPALFSTNSLPFEWDPEAEAPNWEKFLHDIWGDQPDSIECLQEMFGYLLTADTSQQKMFMLIGPRRSGKGTIGRVLSALLGQENISGPTLASLTSQFGLQPLIGKLVAMIADARAPGRDHQMIVERLLMMSGEDLITVDRKNLEAWVGTLAARVVILTNEPLSLGDSSGALVGRMIVLAMSKSFYGQEDTRLTEKLMAELPGIFRWAIAGRDRLNARGFFVQPRGGLEVIEEMENLNSPIHEWAEECCKMVPDASETTDDLYAEWRRWCAANDRRSGTKAIFAKQLTTAFPRLEKSRVSGKEGREYAYFGIKLLKEDVFTSTVGVDV